MTTQGSGEVERDRRAWSWLDIRPPLSSSHDQQLEREAERDLFERAKPGAFVYALVWLVVTPWSGMWSQHTAFAAGNMAFLAGLSALRMFNFRGARRSERAQIAAFRWLTVLILAGALHWGVMSSFVIFSGRFDTLRNPFLIMLPAFGMGGTAVLGISNTIRMLYPAFILFPSMITGTVIGGQENLTLVALATCAMAYVMVASRTSSIDYWKAISNAKVAAERAQLLEIQNLTDPLTGIHNRLFFNTYFRDQWRLCAGSGEPLSVALIDLDHFKKVNDEYGHLAGDECLRMVAAELEHSLRAPDEVVTRYGGEEFVAILPRVGLDEAIGIGRRMVDLVAHISFDHDGIPVTLTCSVGIASMVPSATSDDGHRLIAAADEALYDAKSNGRNQLKTSVTLDRAITAPAREPAPKSRGPQTPA